MSKYCTNCGTQLEDEDLFCYQCGKPQEVDIQPDNTQVQEEPVPTSNQTDNTAIPEETVDASHQTDDSTVQEEAIPAAIQAEDATILEESVDASSQDDSTTTLEDTVTTSSENESTTILEEPVATAIQAEDTTILEEPTPTANQADITLIVDETAPTFNQPEGLDAFSHTPTSKPNKNLNTLLISAGIIVLAAVGSYFVTSNLKPANKVDDTNNVVIEKEVQPEDKYENEKADEDNKAQQQKDHDEDNFKMLTRQYELFGKYDQRISQCATDFNNKYLDSSMSTRDNLAYECKNLKLDIDNSVNDLNALEIDTSSKYYSDYQNMLELAECLQKRISVISEAWDSSIYYGSDAKYFTDEICAPLARDKGPNGNVYYQKFQELYPNVRPIEK